MAELPSPTDENSQESTCRKRKRIPIACGACRARKSRCDGQRPKCSSCLDQSLDCVYVSTSGSKDALVPKIYLDLVEARLASVETDIRRLKFQVSSSHISNRAGAAGDFLPVPGSPSILQDELGSERSPDATDGVGTVEFANEETWAYFGPSSNIAFTRIVRRTLGTLLQKGHGSLSIPSSRPQTQGNTLAVSRPPSPERDLSVSWTAKMADASNLPPDQEVNLLARQFFRETGMLFPYINEAMFWDTYNTLVRSGKKSIRHSWLGLLNMILAMATSTGIVDGLSMEDRYLQSEVYFNRAKTLCLDQMLTGASVEAVQVMLLMTQYLQGTHRSIKTWAIHGLAVRGALQLGLHSAQALQRFDALERETRIRTWYGCVVLDKTLSMTFGRPPSIPQNFIRTPLPCHFIVDHQAQEPTAWSSEENSTLFWNATITLYSITASVIQELYGSNIGDVDVLVTADTASAVFQMEQQLFNWQASLPPTLRLVEGQEVLSAQGDLLAWKFRVILTLRYHNLRILAHRPILDRYLRRMDGSVQLTHEAATLNQIGQMSKSFCLSSAQAIIEIAGVCMNPQNNEGRPGFLGAWWFTLYYTLNASLAIAAIRITDHDRFDGSRTFLPMDALKIDRLDKDLEDAIAIMAKLDTQNKMLEKCVKFTATLRYLLQGLRTEARGFRGHTDGGVSSDTPLAAVSSNDNSLNVDGDMFTSMMDLLPPDLSFQDVGMGAGDLFLSPGFVDSLARQGDLFW